MHQRTGAGPGLHEEKEMTRSGSETRQRPHSLKARFNEAEAALIRAQADRAGVSVAALIRYAVLDQKPLRASRTPAASHEDIGRLLGRLGAIATALREAGADDRSPAQKALFEAACRDLADMRAACFEALGREP